MNPAAKALLANASPADVVNALSRASANFRSNRLLAHTNQFQNGVSAKVKVLNNKHPSYTEPNLAESIAVSSILHLFDGWSYFAESLKATFRAEYAISRHLAYYGELRASMSILAAHGIGVFNSHHVVIGAGEVIHGLPWSRDSGTHQMAWDALVEWGKSSHAGQLIGNDIFAFGAPLNDWINTFQSTTTFNLYGADWVEKWGLDLKRLTKDRATRNEVSYSVCFDHTLPKQSPENIEQWLSEIWIGSEPSSAPFSMLDQYLVRSTLEGIFNTKFKDPADSEVHSAQLLKTRMENTCKALGIQRQDAIDFLTRKTNTSDLLAMTLAAGKSSVNDPMQFQEVLSRTYLLLRLATASVRSLLRKASLSADDLSFWWGHNLAEAGLWDKSCPPLDSEEAKDLWIDVSNALDEFSIHNANHPSGCWFTVHSKIASEVESLSRMEKVALWGIS